MHKKKLEKQTDTNDNVFINDVGSKVRYTEGGTLYRNAEDILDSEVVQSQMKRFRELIQRNLEARDAAGS